MKDIQVVLQGRAGVGLRFHLPEYRSITLDIRSSAPVEKTEGGTMMNCLQPLCKPTTSLIPSTLFGSPHNLQGNPFRKSRELRCCRSRRFVRSRRGVVCGFFPVDPWSPTNIDSQSIASQLFSVSLFPYIGFLYFITKSKSSPRLTLFGFYFLLTFVAATIPAGIYAKVHYGTSLANVDWLHGGAEFLLTLTNLFIVMGLREALGKAKDANESTTDVVLEIKDDKTSSV